MLQIGPRIFELVRASSGFHLRLEKDRHMPSLQHWRFEAHYVPSDEDAFLRTDGTWEHLRLTMFPHEYQVRDWRELTGLGLEPLEEDEDDTWIGGVDIENLLADRGRAENFMVQPHEFSVRRTENYLFSCEFEGTTTYNGQKEKIHFLDEIPFARIFTRVPVNASNPVANAHARAAREIGPFEIAGSHVTPYDWAREKNPNSLDHSHQVSLYTAWRPH